MGYEAHLSDFLKVFGDPFSYVTVVKWTPENEKVFVVVKCNYVTVGLMSTLQGQILVLACWLLAVSELRILAYCRTLPTALLLP